MRTIYNKIFASSNPKLALKTDLDWNLKPKRAAGAFFDKDIPYTPIELCDEIFDKITPIKNRELGIKIGVLYSMEMAVLLHFYGFTDVTLITQDYCEYIANRTGSFCYKYMLLSEVGDMKFDVVVGNPPYNSAKTTNSTNSVKLYMKFLSTARALAPVVGFVLPSKDTSNGNSKLSRIITTGGCIACFDSSAFFDISYNTCWFVLDSSYTGDTILRDINGKVSSIKLEDRMTPSLNGIDIPVLAPGTPTLGDLWTRSKIYRNDPLVGRGSVMMVDSVGIRGDALVLVPTEYPTTSFSNFDKWKVMIPNVGGYTEIGNVKIAPPGVGTSYAIVCFNFDTECDAIAMKDYLESVQVTSLVRSIKVVTPNSKTMFSNIPQP